MQTEIVDFLIWREAEDIRLAELAAAEAGAWGFQAFVASACLWLSHCAHPAERLRLIAEEEARIVRSTHTHVLTSCVRLRSHHAVSCVLREWMHRKRKRKLHATQSGSASRGGLLLQLRVPDRAPKPPSLRHHPAER